MSDNKVINVYESEKELEICHEGEGFIKKKRAFSFEDFESSLDFIDYIEIPPKAKIGIHQHDLNEEVYFIVSGTGMMHLNNGQERIIKSGDVIVNPVYGTHGLVNNSEDEMKVFIFQASL
ncbi:cupin domain-containing protein [Sporosarcina sp. FSL K6-1508]|uniref:cupin domain-containing protein n=1 Tax=Sporosarcina sp. FSL K6-1508 TaxID=2921553 RepID=UPI0030F5F4D7